jgi:hypothetical protein
MLEGATIAEPGIILPSWGDRGRTAVRKVGVFAGALCLPLASLAHHSVSAWFNPNEVIELEGELAELRWQNPHIVFTL